MTSQTPSSLPLMAASSDPPVPNPELTRHDTTASTKIFDSTTTLVNPSLQTSAPSQVGCTYQAQGLVLLTSNTGTYTLLRLGEPENGVHWLLSVHYLQKKENYKFDPWRWGGHCCGWYITVFATITLA